MPARPVVPNVLKVEFLWSQNGIPAANVRYVLYSGTAPTPGAAAAIANDLGGAFWTQADQLYSPETIFEAVRVTDLTTDTGAEGTHSFASPGTAESTALPAQCCMLVNQTISRRYRGGHPRQYYPALALEYMDTPGTWLGAAVTQMGVAEAAYALEGSSFSESGCDGVYIVNVSYRTAGEPRVDPVIDQITGHVVVQEIKTQRRRLLASSY